jgi:indole-3-glycerol phosphate synthase
MPPLADRGGRRFSQAISEGDGISVLAEVDGPEAARSAEDGGAEALVVSGEAVGVRDATELPILWRSSPSVDAAAKAGADAFLLVAAELEDDDGRRLGDAVSRVTALGLDWVVSVANEDELGRVLELHDPEIFHLTGDLENALELLTDVPAGKLAIAEAAGVTREEVLELERRGIDAVIVPSRDVAELVGGAPPTV